MAEDATRLIQEVRESLIRIEGKLENMGDKHINLEKRVSKLEENNAWLWRTVGGAIIAAVMGFIFKK